MLKIQCIDTKIDYLQTLNELTLAHHIIMRLNTALLAVLYNNVEI